MKRNIALSVLLFILALSTNAFAQSAKEAVNALKKLQVQCETGISYRDFSPALAEAKFPVKQYLESHEGNQYKDFSITLNSALLIYESVNAMWNYKFSSSRGINESIKSRYSPSLCDLLLKAYPDMPVHDNTNWLDEQKQNEIIIDEAIPYLFSRARMEIEKASSLLQDIEENQPKEKQEQAIVTTSDTQKQIDSMKKEIENLKKENKSLKKQLEAMKAKSK